MADRYIADGKRKEAPLNDVPHELGGWIVAGKTTV